MSTDARAIMMTTQNDSKLHVDGFLSCAGLASFLLGTAAMLAIWIIRWVPD